MKNESRARWRSGGLLVAALLALLPLQAYAQGLPAAPPEEVGLSAERLSRITETMQAFADSGRFAGAVAVVARGGRVAYRQPIGRFDASAPDALSADHLFRIYSMTKPVTAVAILRLADQGKLRLDDPVSRFIPGFGEVGVYVAGPASAPELRPASRPPTVGDLLSHTSGLTYGVFGNSPVDSLYRAAGLLAAGESLEEFGRRVAALPLQYSPGERWVYSIGQDVAGRVVEVAAGMSFDEFLRREIFEPLGMRNTSFTLPAGMEGRLVPVHEPGPDRRMRPRSGGDEAYRPEARFRSGGGGLISTVDDYLRFAQMLLDGGELDGARILRPESVALMSTDLLPPAIHGTTSAGPTHGFGLSVAVQTADTSPRDPSAAGTYWWAGLASTFFWIDPENDLVALFFMQHMPTGADGAYPVFRRMVYEALEN
jgi:CubicO group peptidase (beta-lactamase class C family)